MMNNILEQVNYFRELGLFPIPVKEDKRPLTKDGTWKNVDHWEDDDFLTAGGIGIEHERSRIIDIDFDNYEAIKFQHLLPPTFSLGKTINGVPRPTHMFYHVDMTPRKISFLADRYKKDSVIVEVLTNTQTVAGGHGRIIIDDREIRKVSSQEYQEILKIVGKISLLTMLSKYYPKQGGRDEYVLRVAGCLTKGNDWSTTEKEDFLLELLKANDDTADLKNRLSKIQYQEDQSKLDPKKVAGIPSFADCIKTDVPVCGEWWNWIGSETRKVATPITAISIRDFIQRQYPPTEYLLYPLVSKQTITQIWASPGVGKTLFSMQLATAISNGENFLKYNWAENAKPVPVLYVEGEMSSRNLQDRICNITSRFQDENKEFNFEYFRIATCEEQENSTFFPLNEENGRKKVELQLEQMKDTFHECPVLFLDNISCLCDIQEKDGKDWNEFMNWLIRLRTIGYTVIFLHHATKEGSSSSGSNTKERAIDIEIKLSIPDKDQRRDIDETQMIVEFKKWREHNFTKHSKSFLASVSRHSNKWSWHEFEKKKNPKEESFNYWYVKEGIRKWSEEMQDHETYPISKGYFYKLKTRRDAETLEQLTTKEVI